MSLVAKFNQKSKAQTIVTKRCSELIPSRKYSLHKLMRKTSVHGECILAVLGGFPHNDEDERVQVFLPKRFCDILADEDLDSIPPGQYYLMSHGPSGNNSTELSLHLA